MNAEAVAWVRANSRAQGDTLRVLCAIAHHAAADGTIIPPSMETIAVMYDLTPRQVHRAIIWLQAHNELTAKLPMTTPVERVRS